MNPTPLLSPDQQRLDPQLIEALQERLGADQVLLPEDQEYDEHRRVYNGAIDRHPALIAVCSKSSHVRDGVLFARRAGLPVGIRGGGHSVAGHGTCDGGLLLDLRHMRGVQVDPQCSRVWVQGGATLRELDEATQLVGLAVPTGQVSATGVAGLTLNGGMGMLQRRFGLTCDNLRAVRLVTSDGVLLEVDDETDPELMWALRGGGGNFGVVTDFCFDAHPVGPEILAGMIAWPVERSADVLSLLCEVIADAPRELSADIIFQQAPPLDVFPPELLGSRLVGIFVRWSGDHQEGEAIVEQFRRLPGAVMDLIAPIPYADVQQMLDPLNPNGNGHYWTGAFIADMAQASRHTLGELGANLPTRTSIIEVIPFNGAATDVAADATAFSHRTDSWLIHVLGQWEDDTEKPAVMEWVQRARRDLALLGFNGESYLNLVSSDETAERVSAFWNDERMSRLRRVKGRLDPHNVFRFNHNIEPPQGTSAPSDHRESR